MAVHLRRVALATLNGASAVIPVATVPAGEHWRVRSVNVFRSGTGTGVVWIGVDNGSDLGFLAFNPALGDLAFLSYGEPDGGQQAMEAGDELQVAYTAGDTLYVIATATVYTD